MLSFTYNQSDLLREIDIFRSEKDEFIELFQALEDALVVKNIDLNKQMFKLNFTNLLEKETGAEICWFLDI